MTSFDGEPVLESYRLRWLTARTSPGKRVKLGVWRNGKALEVPVLLLEKPGARWEPPVRPPGLRREQEPFGFAVEDASKDDDHGREEERRQVLALVRRQRTAEDPAGEADREAAERGRHGSREASEDDARQHDGQVESSRRQRRTTPAACGRSAATAPSPISDPASVQPRAISAAGCRGCTVTW